MCHKPLPWASKGNADLTDGEWMLHVVMMMFQDAVLWFIFELQAALELAFKACAGFLRFGRHACRLFLLADD